MKNPSSKLAHILIGKAIVETVLVGAVAVAFHFNAFPPTFHGWGEPVFLSKAIAGWAVNDAAPWERVEVQLFIDDKFVATQYADKSRPDVSASGWAKDEWHGYEFPGIKLSAGQHTARVYALHRSGGGSRYTLQILGDPIRFEVSAEQTWKATEGP